MEERMSSTADRMGCYPVTIVTYHVIMEIINPKGKATMKPMYKKDDVIVCDLYDKPVKVLDVRIEKMELPYGKRKVTFAEYKVNSPLTKKIVWVDQDQVVGQVKYKPAVIKPEEHVELCQELMGYENLRDYLETLKPRSKADKVAVRMLKEIMENLAKMVSDKADSSQYEESYNEAESLLR
jgi:hypothetical protein